ncbi:MAG: hypothetical protein ACRD82_24050 [Blastocatellia bacterium]
MNTLSASQPLLTLELRLAQSINRVKDPEFFPFLEEAWRCFNAQALNAACVWVYTAAICYVKALVKLVGEDIFEFRYLNPGQDAAGKKRDTQKEYKGLNVIKDFEVIKVCEEMGMLNLRDATILNWVSKLRDKRNDLAHGHWNKPATVDEVINFTEKAVTHFLAIPLDVRQTVVDIFTLRDFAKYANIPLTYERAQKLMPGVNKDIEKLCSDLLGDYLLKEADQVGIDNVKALWRASYGRLPDENQARIQKQVIGKMASFLSLKLTIRKIEDIDRWFVESRVTESNEPVNDWQEQREKFLRFIDLDLWVDRELPAEPKDAFYQIFQHFLQTEVQRQEDTGEYTDLPTRLLIKILVNSPNEYRSSIEQLKTKLQGGSNATNT